MASSSEKQEYIHWLEISESLGVDVSREIEFYFNGVADLGGSPPLSDDIQTEVSSTARQLALSASESDVSQQEVFKMEPVRSASNENETPTQSKLKNSQSAKAAQQTVSKDKNDEKPVKSRDDLPNLLGLDWSAPAPPSTDSPTTRDESETRETPKREKQPVKKQVAVERKPAPPKSASEKQEVDLLGWGTDVKESAVAKSSEAEPPAAETKKEPRPERHAEKPKPKMAEPTRVTPPVAKDVLSDGFGAGLIDPAVASRTATPETPRSPASEAKRKPVSDAPRKPASEAPRKPLREAKVETADHVDPLGFFDSASNEPKRSDFSTDESEIDSLDDDQIEEVEEPLLESAWDEDFVEFEVEDLDPNAGRQPGNRKRESRDSRPTRTEKPVRRDIPGQDDDSADLDADLEAPESKDSRSKDPEREGATRTGTRSSRRRKARGRRKTGENQGDDKPNASKPPEAAPRSKKPASHSRPQPVADLDDDFDDDDDDEFESTSSRDETRSSKPRNLPTWNETVDVIVQSNIASRKKPPARRRRGGNGGNGGNGGSGGSGGGQNRQR